MLTWVPAALVENWHLELIAKAMHAAPEEVRLSSKDMVCGIQNGQYRVFEFSNNGVLVVQKDGKRLELVAMGCKLFQPKKDLLVADLKLLAAHYECDKIAITVFDKRLADVIVSLGGKVESYDLTLPVEQSDEEKDDSNNH